jgi:hypothetical protein
MIKKIALVLLVIGLFILLFATGGYYLMSELRKASTVKQVGIKNITSYMFSTTPNIEGRLYYGNQKAPLVFVAYMDMNSTTSKKFIEDILPKLKDEYIHTGKMRFYAKYYLTKEDYVKKTERFIYAQSLACSGYLSRDNYYSFYAELIGTSLKELGKLVQKYNISKEDFSKCFENIDFPEMHQDSFEAEKFNIISLNPVFYIGVEQPRQIIAGIPVYTDLKRTLKDLQISIGD